VSRDAELAGAAQLLAAAKVVAVPTDTVYGLAVDPRLPAAVAALFELKGRPDHLPLPVLVADTAQALALARLGPAHRALGVLAERFWPGPLTVVVPLVAGASLALGGDGTSVGLRCPATDRLRRLLALTGPLAVTSANRHGQPPCTTAGQVRAVFGGELELVLDGGGCDGVPSSVVSLLGDEPELLRAGQIGLAEISGALVPATGDAERERH
jgi:L-threonylcarbamoyladenylate synthase